MPTTTWYGGSLADIYTGPDAEGDLVAKVGATLSAWDAESGGNQLSNLKTAANASAANVTTGALGRIRFGAVDYNAAIWLQDSAGVRWRIDPADMATRTAAGATTGGGSGASTAAGITDSTAVGRALLTAADAPAARAAFSGDATYVNETAVGTVGGQVLSAATVAAVLSLLGLTGLVVWQSYLDAARKTVQPGTLLIVVGGTRTQVPSWLLAQDFYFERSAA